MWSIVNKQVEAIKDLYLKNNSKYHPIKYKKLCNYVVMYFDVKLSDDEIKAFANDVIERINKDK